MACLACARERRVLGIPCRIRKGEYLRALGHPGGTFVRKRSQEDLQIGRRRSAATCIEVLYQETVRAA